jgi:hypothetical protein
MVVCLPALVTMAVFGIAGSASAEPVPTPAGTVAPPGYVVTSQDSPAAGVEHIALLRANPPLTVNVARIRPGAAVSMRAVLSNDQVAGPPPELERTSSMCARVHCVLAINGDFGTDQPLGGLVTDGELLRTPSTTHHQLSVTAAGALDDTNLEWTGKLLPTDLQPLRLDGLNVGRPPGKVVLYTPAFGPTTQTDGAGVELVLRVIEPAGEFRLGQTAQVELVSLADVAANSAIPKDGAILSGEGAGADALRRLWQRVGTGSAGPRALLRFESPGEVVESVGGSPILIKDGKRWFTDPGDDFTEGRHPRTLVGWTPGGDVLLVTVDGRQPGLSVGMSLFEATDLLLSLGATEGINLDGGGSTTFVAAGNVVNHVSDVTVRSAGQEIVRHAVQPGDVFINHVERPVASALALVPSNPVSVHPVDPLAGSDFGLPQQALALPAPAADHPAPAGSLPALISRRGSDLGGPVADIAVVLGLLGIVSVLTGLAVFRRRFASGF